MITFSNALLTVSRRRREDGELSKGALRAQRAQNRAKAMRQNLLGSSLLSGMLYNQGYQQGPPHPAARPAGPGMPGHPGAQYHLAQHPGDYGVPVGYDIDGRPILRSYAGGGYEHAPHPHPQQPGAEMYRLPPIQDAVGGPSMWDGHDMSHFPPPRMDHWLGHEQGDFNHPHVQASDLTPDEQLHQHGGYFEGAQHYYPSYEDEYRFPPLFDPATAPRTAVPAPDMSGLHGDHTTTTAAAAAAAGATSMPEAPSGHVIFNERLFDGALGSAPMAGRRDLDEGLGAFDEAVAQANETSAW